MKSSILKHKGMTLIEVLVALSVFAISSSAIIYTVSNSINGIIGLQERFDAEIIAGNVLSELKLAKKWPSNSWVTDKYAISDRTYYYRYRGQNTQDANFKAVDVEVFISSQVNTETPVATLRTYFNR